jgi:hypothetical protein
MRIRQIVFAARDLAPTSAALARLLALDAPFADPGVAEFSLHNAVYVFGDQFIEIVSPMRGGTTAGRLLERRGDCGYMLILQTDDFARARARFTALGVRAVFEIAYDDIRAVHLHPKDIGGAIVSVDQPLPAAAWRWGGPQWRLQPGPAQAQRVLGVSVAADDPLATAQRWAEVLGLAPPQPRRAGWRLPLDGGALDFVAADARGQGIVGYALAVADVGAVRARAAELGLPLHGDGLMLMGTRITLSAL